MRCWGWRNPAGDLQDARYNDIIEAITKMQDRTNMCLERIYELGFHLVVVEVDVRVVAEFTMEPADARPGE